MANSLYTRSCPTHDLGSSPPDTETRSTTCRVQRLRFVGNGECSFTNAGSPLAARAGSFLLQVPCTTSTKRTRASLRCPTNDPSDNTLPVLTWIWWWSEKSIPFLPTEMTDTTNPGLRCQGQVCRLRWHVAMNCLGGTLVEGFPGPIRSKREEGILAASD